MHRVTLQLIYVGCIEGGLLWVSEASTAICHCCNIISQYHFPSTCLPCMGILKNNSVLTCVERMIVGSRSTEGGLFTPVTITTICCYYSTILYNTEA